METMLNNSINVYWACFEDSWMVANPPSSVASSFYTRMKFNINEQHSLLSRCPSFNSHLKNLFELRSIYDYSFRIEEKNLVSDMYDQEFFNKHVLIRSLENKFFTFANKYIFFTDEPSLEVTFYEYPYLEDNNITQRCIIPSGRYDIGKWYRNTEFSFLLKRDFNEFKIEKDEVYGYMRFHTDKQLNFKQYRFNEKLLALLNDGQRINNRNPLYTLENFYKNFKNKKLILKEIQDNLII